MGSSKACAMVLMQASSLRENFYTYLSLPFCCCCHITDWNYRLLFGQKLDCLTFLHNTLLTIYLFICFEHGDSAADLQVCQEKIFIQMKILECFIWPPYIQTSQRYFCQCKIYRTGVLALTNTRKCQKTFL